MNWRPQDILNAADNVEFENTNYLGKGKKYSRFMVPGGGLIYPGYDLNHSYEDCDVFVSLAKLKEHAATGVTLSMKNVYGATPITIYGEGAGVDEPSIRPHGGRGGVFHFASRVPSKSAPQQKDMTLAQGRRLQASAHRSRNLRGAAGPPGDHRRHSVRHRRGDQLRGSRPQAAVNPGVLIAGTNCVATDAVAMAVMGFDPMADRGTPRSPTPTACCASVKTWESACATPKNEIVGTPISEVVFSYSAVREKILAAEKKA